MGLLPLPVGRKPVCHRLCLRLQPLVSRQWTIIRSLDTLQEVDDCLAVALDPVSGLTAALLALHIGNQIIEVRQ